MSLYFVLYGLLYSRLSIYFSKVIVERMYHSDANAINEYLKEEKIKTNFSYSSVLRDSFGYMRSISLSSLLYDTVFIFLSLNIFFMLGSSQLALSCLIVTSVLFLLSRIDFEDMLLPDMLLAILFSLGVFINIKVYPLVDVDNALISMVVSFYSVYLFVKCYEFFRKKEIMGRGDIKLFALSFFFFPSSMFSSHIVVSSSVFLIYTAAHNIYAQSKTSNDSEQHFPFGPAICLSIYLHMMYGEVLQKISGLFI